jgi:hypothetical protein
MIGIWAQAQGACLGSAYSLAYGTRIRINYKRIN